MNTATAMIEVNGNGTMGNLDNGAGPGAESLHARLDAPIRTNAAQIEARATMADGKAALAVGRANHEKRNKAERAAAADAKYQHHLAGIRAGLTDRLTDDECIAMAEATLEENWRHPRWNIARNVSTKEAEAMWICATRGMEMPAKRRITLAEYKAHRATQEEFLAAQAYRSLMNRYQHGRSRGYVLLGMPEKATANARKAKKGKGKGKGKGGAELISRAKADEYVAALVAFCDANVSETSDVLSPLMKVIEQASRQARADIAHASLPGALADVYAEVSAIKASRS